MTKMFALTDEGQKDFKAKLAKAFRALRKDGYFARQNFQDCQSCAWSLVPDGAKKVVFYHQQDNEDIPGGFVYLAFGGDDVDGQEIVKALNDAGLPTIWNGSRGQRIEVVYMAGQA